MKMHCILIQVPLKLRQLHSQLAKLATEFAKITLKKNSDKSKLHKPKAKCINELDKHNTCSQLEA